MKSLFRPRNILILVVITLAGLWFFNSRKKTPVYLDKDSKKHTYKVSPTSLRSTLNLSGNIEAEEKVTLQFQTSGKLTWVGVKEGDEVQKWQIIATLDQRELQKSLDKKLKDFMLSRWDFDQNKDDYKSAYTGADNIYLTDKITRIAQKTQFNLDKSIIDVEVADLAFETSRLFSPITGIVTHIDQPFAGVNITPSTARFEIINPKTVYLRAVVDQQDVVKLKNGMSASIVFDAFPDKTYRGSIYYLAFAPESGEENSYAVKVTVPESMHSLLRLGMGAEVSINVSYKNRALAIPLEALIEEENRKYVMLLRGEKTVKKRIYTGLETDELIEVKKGLKKNDIIVY